MWYNRKGKRFWLSTPIFIKPNESKDSQQTSNMNSGLSYLKATPISIIEKKNLNMLCLHRLYYYCIKENLNRFFLGPICHLSDRLKSIALYLLLYVYRLLCEYSVRVSLFWSVERRFDYIPRHCNAYVFPCFENVF